MNYNPNKAVSANSQGIKVFYTDSLKSHSISYEETSPLKDLQIGGNQNNLKSYQPIVNSGITQKVLYNQAMYGLKTYSQDQLDKMTYVQKMHIKDIYEKAQHHINLWKHELVHNKIGSFLTTLFYKSEFASKLATYPKAISAWDKSPLTLRDLGIRKEMIEEKLIQLRILPSNYYQLVA